MQPEILNLDNCQQIFILALLFFQWRAGTRSTGGFSKQNQLKKSFIYQPFALIPQ